MTHLRNENVQVTNDRSTFTFEKKSKENEVDSPFKSSTVKEGNQSIAKTDSHNDFKVDQGFSSSSSSGETTDLKIRDFAFGHSDPRHWGEYGKDVDIGSQGLSKAIALYDFEAENPSELSFMQDDILTIQHKQCAGWLVGFKVEEKVGLIPESFVRFIN
ncbi:HOG (high osmolarity glycerol) pathway protein [Basidiobolus ranarum]|uniref:HOG (High osmolarity glycerol) pathway protein n=1 Tax=Basidiobolus ranarum TaxID=34480 RepID=A0ABR2X4U6_9FUNG